MNEIIEALPGVQAVDQERARIEADWATYLQWKNEQAARYEREKEDHKAALRLAIEKRKDPPPAPASPALDDEHARRLVQHRADMDRLDRARYRAIADAAGVVHRAARAETSAAMEKARPHLEALEEILKRIRSAQDATREVLVAQDLVRGLHTLRSGPQRADLAALADAIRFGGDLLHVRQENGILVDRGEDDGNHTPRPTSRRLGMAVSNVRTVPDTSDWEPRSGSWQPTN